MQNNASFHKFEDTPINCVLGSTVVFEKNPLYKCKFLSLYLFDCCRACNAVYDKCMKSPAGKYHGGPEYCYRDSYKCMCKCLAKHTPPENRFPAVRPWGWISTVTRAQSASRNFAPTTLSLPWKFKICIQEKNSNANLPCTVKNKLQRGKVLLKSFCLNSHTLGFHPWTKNLEPHWNLAKSSVIVTTTLCHKIKSTPGKHCSVAFNWMVTL